MNDVRDSPSRGSAGSLLEGDGHLYTNGLHCTGVLSNLNQYRKSGQLCDVTLKCEDGLLLAHRAVLSANCDYFRSMFCNGMMESSSDEIVIKGVDYNSLSLLVEYCYTSTLMITQTNVKKLHVAANIFNFQEVQKACEMFLLGRISIENCLTVSQYAAQHSCYRLMESADTFTRNHFVDISRTPYFYDLDKDHLIRLIAHDDLSVCSELTVFQAVIEWVKYDKDKRRLFLSDLVKHVRLGTISPKLLLDCVETEPLVLEEPKCRSLLDEVKAYHLLPECRAEMSSVLTKRRKWSALCLYAVGGENNSGTKLNSVERYHSEAKVWLQVAGMNTGRSSMGVTVCNGNLYVGGGFDGSTFLNSVERYVPYSNSWTNIAPLKCSRSCMGMECLNDFVYAIGGRLEESRLSTVERYDSHRDKWFSAGSMATSRSAAGVAVMDNCIYVVGGYDGNTDLNTVERYDPRLDRWSQVGPMTKHRSLTAAVALNGLIYVPGGQILMTMLDYVECYDPRNNQWYSMAPLMSPRYGFGAGVVGGKMYVAGGCNGAARLNTVEMYDPILNSWSLGPTMGDQRHSLGVGSL